MTVGTGPTLARAFRRAALPLSAYYAVTIALPIINGAAQSGSRFVAHAVVVLALPLILIGLACMGHAMARLLLRAGRAVLPGERSRRRLRQRAIAIEYAKAGE